MPTDKNRNKIYTALVLCIGIVVSVWLLDRKPESSALAKQTDSISAGSENTLIGTNNSDDWKKILSNVSPKYVDTPGVTTSNNSQTFDETTLTAQMARDMFSRYLLAANKQDGSVTPQDVNQIANDIVASPQYTSATGIQYNELDLNIVKTLDAASLKIYGDTVNGIFQTRLAQIKVKENAVTILEDALNTEDAKKLSDLDSIITANKNIVSDLLKMNVPQDVVGLHLALVNASSNVLSNIQAMQQAFIDPVKAFIGINQYSGHVNDVQNALENISAYYKKRLGIK